MNLINGFSLIKKNKEYIALSVFALLIFIFGIWRITEISQPILFSDEYGYWANSSYLMGLDWSSLTSRIPYYSYGYSLLLIPIRVIGNLFDWEYYQLYQAGIVLNALLLVFGYFLAVKICRRYFTNMHWFVGMMACGVTFLYSSNIFYSHVLMTETTLLFMFWLFLFVMMRMTDKPGIGNHISYALVVIFMYTVHQRAIGIVITSVVIVICLSLLKRSKMIDSVAFFITLYAGGMVHSLIKKSLQNDYYLGQTPMSWEALLSGIISIRNIAIAVAIVALLSALYLMRKGKWKWVLIGVLTIIIAAGFFLSKNGFLLNTVNDVSDMRISNNDFAGQWGKILGIFSPSGLTRLGISIVGKWFYMAAGTGLIVCWSMKNLIKHAFGFAIKNRTPNDIWLFGVFLAWIGTFLICAIYKEGFFKNDDLVHGRYNEFIMGILILYGFYSLVTDAHWLRTMMISLVMYAIAGGLCEYAFTQVQRTEFELCHSVMFGRVFWNFEVLVGKVKILSGYVLPLGISFVCAVGLGKRFLEKNRKTAAVILSVALLIPMTAWNYLSASIIDHYNVQVNRKQQVSMYEPGFWIRLLDWDQDRKIYYLEDRLYFRNAEGLQYVLQDSPITMIDSTAVSFDEDAFYIMDEEFANCQEVRDQCEIILQTANFTVAINKNQTLMERWIQMGKNGK